MKQATTYKQLVKEFEKVHSIVSDDTRFIAIALMYQIGRNERHRKKQPNRKLSAYNVFMSKGLKEGKAFKEIVDLWNKQKQPQP